MRRRIFMIAMAATCFFGLSSIDVMASDSEKEVNVIDFGANGEDEEIDTYAIQQCLNTAKYSDGKVTVTIPKGTYYIDDALRVYGDTVIEMDQETVIEAVKDMSHMMYNPSNSGDGKITLKGGVFTGEKLSKTVSAISFKGLKGFYADGIAMKNLGGSGILVQNCNDVEVVNINAKKLYSAAINVQRSDVRIADCFVDGIGIRTGSGNAVYVRDCKDTVIENCKIKNTGYNAITANGCKKLTISKVNAYMLGNCGFTVYHCGNVLIENSKVDMHRSDGIWVENLSTGNCVIKNNIVNNSSEDKRCSGIVVFYGKSVDINRNHIENTHNNAIYTKISNDVKIRNNTIKKTGQNGMIMLKIKGVISGNKISGVKYTGISLNTVSDVVVTGNTVSAPGQMGIYSNTNKNVTIKNNKVTSAKKNSIHVQKGDKIRVSGNTITGGSANGVYAKSTKRLQIWSNRITKVKVRPICISSGCTGSVRNNTYTLIKGGKDIYTDKLVCTKNKKR